MTKLIPYPLAEPISSKEGWEAGIKEKRQTDQRGRGKMGPLPATFLIPVLWLGDGRCSAQEAHPLPALPSSTHRETRPERNRGPRTSMGRGVGENEASPRMLQEF